jgi:uncharacterized protein involved in exopolysaccharide biosynthesis
MGQDDSGEGITVRDALSILTRIWRRAFLVGLLAIPAAVLIGLVRPKNYVATASFVAEQTKLASLPSGLGALAAQFGLDMPGDAGRSPQFYSELLRTSELLRDLLDTMVPLPSGASTTIRVLLTGSTDTSRRNTDRALRKLRRRIGAGADARTSVVTFSVRAKTPLIAERMAQALISEIKHFNVTTRQLQARERRQFLDGRVADAYQNLRSTEEALRQFYERNRRFSESPTLLFEESRMKRAIELQQELYTTLSKELETARIQEVNDTPTITIIDPPFAPSRPSGPTVLVLAVIAFLLGAGGAGLWLGATLSSQQHPTVATGAGG